MHFRYARHTNDLDKIREFYTQILNLEVLGSFGGHGRYDGLFLGKKDLDWHLEFTSSSEPADHTFDEDDLLVFYPASQKEHDHILEKLKSEGIETLEARNSYWNQNGVLFSDPDGHGIVVSPLRIKK